MGFEKFLFYVFAAILVFAATAADNNGKVIETGHLVGLVIGFIVLFILSGLANGSVYKIIPSVFDAASRSLPLDEAGRAAYSRSMSGAVIGIAGAIGGLGGVGINLVLRQSFQATGTATVAFAVFAAGYLVAALITWRAYVAMPGGATGRIAAVSDAVGGKMPV